MRSVWSFWTKPFENSRRSAWQSEKQHLLSWVLSVETARQHYPNTCLVTDGKGARMLVDGIGLEFENVSTALEALKDCHADWWSMGKLHAYRRQSDPFIHIDSDVYLWKRLRPRVESADVFAQSPEWFSFDRGSWYRPKQCIDALKSTGGRVPDEWTWYAERRGNQAACCGVIGGNDTAFIRHYADVGIKSVEDPRNASGWSSLGGNMADTLLIEQYSIIACIEYHNAIGDPSTRNIDIRYLFDSPEEAFDQDRARDVGYTHLIGGAKQNEALAERLERRVRRDYPARYEACLRYLRDTGRVETAVELADP